MADATAYVLLEDGTRFDGEACAAEGHAVGEVVFTTGMSVYQESMSDPSFAGQLIAFTYPHIGNYGASARAMESERPWARAAIMREGCNREDAPSAERGWLDWLTDCGVMWISGVDTRSLVRHIRHAGAMRGGVFAGALPESRARELIAAEPRLPGPVPQVIERERPDALLAALGGQTGLNIAKALHDDGTLERFEVELIGANYDAIACAEDRELFAAAVPDAGLRMPKSAI